MRVGDRAGVTLQSETGDVKPPSQSILSSSSARTLVTEGQHTTHATGVEKRDLSPVNRILQGRGPREDHNSAHCGRCGSVCFRRNWSTCEEENRLKHCQDEQRQKQGDQRWCARRVFILTTTSPTRNGPRPVTAIYSVSPVLISRQSVFLGKDK